MSNVDWGFHMWIKINGPKGMAFSSQDLRRKYKSDHTLCRTDVA